MELLPQIGFVIFSLLLVNAEQSNNCECGMANDLIIDTRIIGGNIVQPHLYPWVVYLTYSDQKYCGGAIINSRYILTAAHCLYQMQAPQMKVIVGGHDSFLKDGYAVGVEKTIMHPNYRRFYAHDNNDIGLMKLSEDLQFNYKIRPICLPKTERNITNNVAIISGWGTTQYGGKESRFLLENRVRVLPQILCKKAKQIGEKFISTQNICAYSYDTDTCQGDSGSSLFTELDNGKYEALGVVSWGIKCASKRTPAVYTKITNYMDWIKKNSNDGARCKNNN